MCVRFISPKTSPQQFLLHWLGGGCRTERLSLEASRDPCPGPQLMSLCSPLQEMAGRALKQTGSRSIEAALEFISKMGYLEPGKEQIVRVVKQTSPGEHAGGYGEAAVGRGPRGHHAAPPPSQEWGHGD